jgi:hypothetical protein
MNIKCKLSGENRREKKKRGRDKWENKQSAQVSQ